MAARRPDIHRVSHDPLTTTQATHWCLGLAHSLVDKITPAYPRVYGARARATSRS
jgi:hypothetical protein